MKKVDNQLLTGLIPPEEYLLYRSQDPLDVRLGSVVSTDPADYEPARIVLLSCGQDEGVRRNNGRVGASTGPESIRKCLYKLASPADLEKNQFIDLGDTVCDGALEEVHSRHRSVVEQILRDGKQVVVLGGGNDISYPDGAAVQGVFPGSLTVNIDAHLDIRKNVSANSGTPYRQLIDEHIISPAEFMEIGIQPHVNSIHYLRDAKNLGIRVVPLSEILQSDPVEILESVLAGQERRTAFLGFDMDSVKAADAPGTSAPSPTGLRAEQAVSMIKFMARQLDIRLFEISEVNPLYDIDNRTAKLAAVMIYSLIDVVCGNRPRY